MSINRQDTAIENFQFLIDNYESALQHITKELDEVQVEQKGIKSLLDENFELRQQLEQILEKNSSDISGNFQENEYIENLKKQLQIAINEKETVLKLWQNASKNIDTLEDELKIYHSSAAFQNVVPKQNLIDLRKTYQDKITELENNLEKTKIEAVGLKAMKDNEIGGSFANSQKTFKIVHNLEEEITKLQERLNEAKAFNIKYEKESSSRQGEIDKLKLKTTECRHKVEEALQIVEAAMNEKDAALFREAEAKEECLKLGRLYTELVETSEEKIRSDVNAIKSEYEAKITKLENQLTLYKEKMEVRTLEMENIVKKCQTLEQEVNVIRKERVLSSGDTDSTFKVLSLEKNLENTFQKLLLSEKQNIQLKSEKMSIKSDLDQMAEHYTRDIQCRELEKARLKQEIILLKKQLDEMSTNLLQCQEKIIVLNDTHSTVQQSLKTELEQIKSDAEAKALEFTKTDETHRKLNNELEDQLKSQMAINKRWRTETAAITTKLEDRINDFKAELSKLKTENRRLIEKLTESNTKILEYKKFLEMIAKDVSKITTLTAPT